MTIPDKINLGSGKDFRADYLNIDISDYWSPDIVADMSTTLFENSGNNFTTRRFGPITLEKGSFSEIIANDVLEHIPHLVAAMTNCLELLKVGGLFNIIVPYDLSYGAWQDPTHVRAFNERSWLYYTDWFWYLGWKTHRFNLRKLDFSLSPLGQAMLAAKESHEAILKTSRAVDAMQVSLEKIYLSDKDRQMLDTMSHSRRMIAESSS